MLSNKRWAPVSQTDGLWGDTSPTELPLFLSPLSIFLAIIALIIHSLALRLFIINTVISLWHYHSLSALTKENFFLVSFYLLPVNAFSLTFQSVTINILLCWNTEIPSQYTTQWLCLCAWSTKRMKKKLREGWGGKHFRTRQGEKWIIETWSWKECCKNRGWELKETERVRLRGWSRRR